ncbi:MAG TPA: dihydrofolate reductase [Marinagarivorans sp.]
MTDVPIALMVAMSNNRCIGIDNTLPWHLPEDLKHFKNTTSHKPIIMGRKTFDSIGRPLPHRENIVVTRNADWRAEGVEVVSDLTQACRQANLAATKMSADEVVCIGGAQIYQAMLPMASRIYLTRVDAEIDGDAFFPEFDETLWERVSQTHYKSDSSNPYDYAFEYWVKK